MLRCIWSDFLCQSSRSSHPEMFLRKGVLKICSKFTGEHTSRSVISIQLLRDLTEIALRHECSPANLLHIFRTHFSKNTSGRLFLEFIEGVLEKKKIWMNLRRSYVNRTKYFTFSLLVPLKSWNYQITMTYKFFANINGSEWETTKRLWQRRISNPLEHLW